MYNLTVDTAHTFFVGEGQWLVHNCAAKITGQSQVTKAPYHDALSDKWATAFSELPTSVELFKNKALNTITGGQVPSRLRPDVAVKFKDGSFQLLEVVSKTQSQSGMMKKMRYMEDLLYSYGLTVIDGIVVP